MEEKNSYFKSQKGITLFIFVITVIVMLTLAGMAMSYLIGPEGVLKQAENSVSKAEKLRIYERISAIAADTQTDGILDVNEIIKKVKDDFNVILTGVSYENDEIKFKDRIVKIKGEKGQYNYFINKNEVRMTESEPYEIKEGEIIKFDSDLDGEKEDWLVLDDIIDDVTNKEKNYVELLSCEVIGKLTLGMKDSWINWNDPKVIENANVIDDANVLLSNTEKAIYSYNNAAYTIQSYCNSLIKAENIGVRNFNSPIINESWNEKTLNETDSTYRNIGGYATQYGKFIYESTNYEKYNDSDKLKKLNALQMLTITTEAKRFWSSYISTGAYDDTFVDCSVGTFRIEYSMFFRGGMFQLLKITKGNLSPTSKEFGVLPVIRIECN